MAQQLRALAALSKDSGLTPSTHIEAHICNSSPRGSNTFWPLETLGMNIKETFILSKRISMKTCQIIILLRDKEYQG